MEKRSVLTTLGINLISGLIGGALVVGGEKYFSQNDYEVLARYIWTETRRIQQGDSYRTYALETRRNCSEELRRVSVNRINVTIQEMNGRKALITGNDAISSNILF